MTRAKPAPLDFVIVGAQRSASTYLSECLRHHPEIFMCVDEVPYFEHPFFENSSESALRAMFASATPGQRLGIHRPNYLGRPECAANIRSCAPSARILAVLRDPIARAISAYFWYMQFGLLPLVPLDVGMEHLLSGWSDTKYPRAREIIEFGFYGRQLTRFVDGFGRDNVLILLANRLRDPATESRVYDFLGVDQAHRHRLEGRRNPGVYDLRRLRWLRARRRFAWSWDEVSVFTYRRRRWRRPLRFLPNAAIVGIDRVVLARIYGNPMPSLRPDLESRLRAVYAPDVGNLETLMGTDLTSWREGPASEPTTAVG
jgi:hypothetical protein